MSHYAKCVVTLGWSLTLPEPRPPSVKWACTVLTDSTGGEGRAALGLLASALRMEKEAQEAMVPPVSCRTRAA